MLKLGGFSSTGRSGAPSLPGMGNGSPPAPRFADLYTIRMWSGSSGRDGSIQMMESLASFVVESPVALWPRAPVDAVGVPMPAPARDLASDSESLSKSDLKFSPSGSDPSPSGSLPMLSLECWNHGPQGRNTVPGRHQLHRQMRIRVNFSSKGHEERAIIVMRCPLAGNEMRNAHVPPGKICSLYSLRPRLRVQRQWRLRAVHAKPSCRPHAESFCRKVRHPFPPCSGGSPTRLQHSTERDGRICRRVWPWSRSRLQACQVT
jgi:hypothetical protein